MDIFVSLLLLLNENEITRLFSTILSFVPTVSVSVFSKNKKKQKNVNAISWMEILNVTKITIIKLKYYKKKQNKNFL